MANSAFVYVTYIRSPQQRVWDALTKPEFQKLYWFGGHQESTWKPGAEWKMFMPQHGLTDSGEILESDPPNRVVIKWRNEFRPNLKAEGYARCVMELTQEAELLTDAPAETIAIALWAHAHGLVSLELAAAMPDDFDVEAHYQGMLAAALRGWLKNP